MTTEEQFVESRKFEARIETLSTAKHIRMSNHSAEDVLGSAEKIYTWLIVGLEPTPNPPTNDK